LGDDFRIRVAAEDDAFCLKLAPKGRIVLYDAVVNHCHEAIAADLRMSVRVGGGAMCRPARVADAERAGRRSFVK